VNGAYGVCGGGESGEGLEDQNADGNAVKVKYWRFQMGMRALWRNGLEAMHFTLWQRIWLPFVYAQDFVGG
jgi:hypothetical protein